MSSFQTLFNVFIYNQVIVKHNIALIVLFNSGEKIEYDIKLSMYIYFFQEKKALLRHLKRAQY